jgi:hypothetical protein
MIPHSLSTNSSPWHGRQTIPTLMPHDIVLVAGHDGLDAVPSFHTVLTLPSLHPLFRRAPAVMVRAPI